VLRDVLLFCGLHLCAAPLVSSASSCPTLAQSTPRERPFTSSHFYFPSLPSDEWRTHELALPTIPPPPAHLFSLHCLFPRSHSHLAVLPCDWTLQHVTSEVRVCVTLLHTTHPRVALSAFTSPPPLALSHIAGAGYGSVKAAWAAKPEVCTPPSISLTHIRSRARVRVRVRVCVCVCAQPARHTRLPTTTERALCAHASLNTI
jgi:hypothetical protein